MSFEIDWIQEHPEREVAQSMIDMMEACLQATGEITETGQGEFSLMFVDETRIQEINRDYRNIDRPTDVISFALNDDDEDESAFDDIEELAYHLGDIVICIDVAEKQAEEYGHSMEREMCFLAVHGLLHLLGYDHQDLQQEQEMFGLQEEILRSKGL